jgi:hypothetical protein
MKMKIKWIFLIWLIFVFTLSQVNAQTKTSTPLSGSSLDIERQRLEVERMKLENEKLKLELEKLKLQATAQPSTEKSEKIAKEGNRKEDIQVYQADISKKAEDLAKLNKDKNDVLILDFVNAEGWHHGVRYNLHQLYSLAEDQKWPLKKKLNGRLPNGVPRYLYPIQNISLLKYESRDRGIIEIGLVQKEGDFNILTPEGISLASSIGDIRNAYQSLYFSLDSQYERDKLRVLKYKHSQGLNFGDFLEVFFDHDGKLVRIRYGVLDEH